MTKTYTRILRLFIAAFFLAVTLSATAKPMVTVIPFNAIGLSENDVLGITLLFETALQNTDTFTLIEQTQAESILQAQKYSLSGCVDESCAIEIGRLLSADQIVLGTVGKVADLYYLTVKIIDVQSGQNLVAQKIQNRSMTLLVENLDSFALLLTGKDEPAKKPDVRLSDKNERTQQREDAKTTTLTYEDGARYVGEVRDGQPNGHGIFYHSNTGSFAGDRYEGEFRDGNFHGQGTYYYFANGHRYEGEFENGKFHGRGTLFHADGSRYEGEFVDNNRHGQGTYYSANGDRRIGRWSNDELAEGWFFAANGNKTRVIASKPVGDEKNETPENIFLQILLAVAGIVGAIIVEVLAVAG